MSLVDDIQLLSTKTNYGIVQTDKFTIHQSLFSVAVSMGRANIRRPVTRNKPPLIYTGVLVATPVWEEMTGAAMPQM